MKNVQAELKIDFLELGQSMMLKNRNLMLWMPRTLDAGPRILSIHQIFGNFFLENGILAILYCYPEHFHVPKMFLQNPMQTSKLMEIKRILINDNFSKEKVPFPQDSLYSVSFSVHKYYNVN